MRPCTIYHRTQERHIFLHCTWPKWGSKKLSTYIIDTYFKSSNTKATNTVSAPLDNICTSLCYPNSHLPTNGLCSYSYQEYEFLYNETPLTYSMIWALSLSSFSNKFTFMLTFFLTFMIIAYISIPKDLKICFFKYLW